MSLKKPSLSEEQLNRVWELVSAELSGRQIAKKTNIDQSTIWRNMEFMGWNKRQRRTRCNAQYFNWKDFDNSVI